MNPLLNLKNKTKASWSDISKKCDLTVPTLIKLSKVNKYNINKIKMGTYLNLLYKLNVDLLDVLDDD